MSKSKNLVILILVVLILALAGIGIYLWNQSQSKEDELSEVVELMNQEKERVASEYEDLTVQFDGYTTTIRNDSLLKLLDTEKARVKELLDELRQTKATNAKKIQELKDELAAIRKIMMHLVAQIDSLNTENQMLKSENSQIRMKYESSSQAVEQLSQEKENLNEVVTRASKLEVVEFNLTTLNDKNRKTSLVSRIANLQINYTIGKNITANPGKKMLYLRLTRPDGEVLTKSPSHTFRFENRDIEYSARKEYEFGGDALSDVIYWKVEEIIQQGIYRAEFFTDGDLIGSFTFTLKK